METADDIFDLREFVFTILHRWRVIVVLGILFAILGGAYKVIPGIMNLRDAEKLEEQQKSYQDSLTAYEQQKEGLEREIENLNEEIERSQEYNEKSLLMKINPYDESVVSQSFYVNTGYQIMPGMDYQNPDKTSQIINLYLMMARDGAMYERMQQELFPEVELRYLKEVVAVSREDSDTITIRAIGENLEAPKKMVAFIYEALMEKQPSIMESAGNHTLKLLNRSEYSTVDLPLRDTQKNNNDKVTELGSALTQKNKELTELEEPENVTTNKRSVLTSGLKFAILGGIGGVGMAVLFIFFIDVMDTRLRDEMEIKKRFGLRYLGSLPREGKKRA